MNRNILISLILVITLSLYLAKNIYTERFIDDIEITDADDYKDDSTNLDNVDNVDDENSSDMKDSMLAMQDFTTFAIKGDRGEPGEKGDQGPIGNKGVKGGRGPQGESVSGSIQSTGKLWLGSDNLGNSGTDNNYETQLYLGGEHNKGANNGRIGHTTYKLKIDGYDNNGSVVYPIYIQDENKNVDFYIKNRQSPTQKPLVAVNGDLKLISQNSNLETPLITANKIVLNGKDVYHHLMPKGTIVAYNGTTNIPNGWRICDGNHGTPDLRGRFILGQSTSKRFGSKGGEERVRLTEGQMPSHNHSMSSNGNHGHHLKWARNSDTTGKGFDRSYWEWNIRNGQKSSGNHSHTIYHKGGNQSHNNMPPYYVLVYIMKVI